MSKFRVQWSDDVKKRTIESPKGDYRVCLEGYFDFNEALMKLMVSQGSMLPVSSQFEPDSDSDSEDDMNFVEPQFDDVCDAMLEINRLSEKFVSSQVQAKAAPAARQKDEDSSDSVKDEVEQKE